MPPLEPSSAASGGDRRASMKFTDQLHGLIAGLEEGAANSFAAKGRIKSFWEYLADLAERPHVLTRSAAKYLLDMIEHFGSHQVEGIGRQLTHYRVFDGQPFSEHSSLSGQEEVVEGLVSILRNFALARRSDKLVVLHGPNGSAKSTLVSLLMDGLEAYSQETVGTVYRFQWVFPAHDETAESVGFVSGKASAPVDSLDKGTFAFLQAEEIAARMPCELKCHPYLLVPPSLRRRLFEDVLGIEAGRAGDSPAAKRALESLREQLLSAQMLTSDLCPKCKAIYDALLTAYQGDLGKLWRHVQVERFYFSRRFRTGAVIIEPQLQNVDAWVRQITADQSIQFLPAALQNLRLFEPGGDLIEANRGILEYSDLLKRPREAFKYLLVTSEQGILHLPNLIAYLDVVLLATVNELHLDEFKNTDANPDYVSFKARMEFVTVPYLLRVTQEEKIYQTQIRPILRGTHIAPHTLELAALWAVLTRLRKPDPEHYPASVRSLIMRLDPLAKAQLYDNPRAELPNFRSDESHSLGSQAERMQREFSESDNYEGRFGASAREMKSVLLEASQRTAHPCVNPLDMLGELRDLCTRESTHLFLRVAKEKLGFREPKALIEVVAAEYVRRLTEEVQSAMGLVSEEECERLFEQYIEHVIAFTTGKKVKNAHTGASEDADVALMNKLEEVFDVKESKPAFRRNLGGQIGAYAMEHPSEKISYGRVFPKLMHALRQDVYSKKLETVRRVERGILLYGHADFASLPPKDQERVRQTIENLESRFGYCEHCARDSTAFLIKRQARS